MYEDIIEIGKRMCFQGEYDVEYGTVLGFTPHGQVALDVMGVETYVDADCLFDDPADVL